MKWFVGVGLGNMTLRLDRYRFSAGDTIHGRLSYELIRDVDAKELRVGLYGTQRIMETRRHADGGRARSTRSDTVYDFDLPLEGPGVFRRGEHEFELLVPVDLSTSAQKPPGALGDVVQAISFLLPIAQFPLKWTVRASLRIPWKLNLKAQQQIQVQF